MATDQQPPTNQTIVSRYEEYIMPVWKQLDVPVKRASDCVLEDHDGAEYLDLFSGISVTNVGHTRSDVVEAAQDQLDDFGHSCSYVHPNEPVTRLAERIAEITPGDLRKTFFCNSGTEAVEGAIKLARKYTGRKEIVSLQLSFHGRTLGSLALTGNETYKHGMAPTLNDVTHAAPPYAYRCQRCDGECTSDCALDLERVITAQTSGDVAAVVVEPVLGEGGIIVPPDDWLGRIQEVTHDHGGLLIVDEVQTGYGRTGTMFACEQFDVTPDILTQAKGIANGLPLGAFTAPPEIADAFEAGDHFSTFGGNPVCCAAAVATIDALQNGIIENAREQGRWLGETLQGFDAEFESIGEIRGLGLMYGIEIVDPDGDGGPLGVASPPAPDRAQAVVDRLAEQGIVTAVGGFHKNVLRIQPPLTITRQQLERATDAIREAFEAEGDS